jgi:DNA mismatch repair ATPase MutS
MSAAEYWMHAVATLAQIGCFVVGAGALVCVVDRIVEPVWHRDEFYPRLSRLWQN